MDATKNCATSDLIVNLKTGVRRFKAGAELSSKVNMVDVNFNQELVGETLVTDLKLHLQVKECAALPIIK
jgi:hypothetical protein